LHPNSEQALPGYAVSRVEGHDHEIAQQQYSEPNWRALSNLSLGANGSHKTVNGKTLNSEWLIS
jgi:hypothetical protein